VICMYVIQYFSFKNPKTYLASKVTKRRATNWHATKRRRAETLRRKFKYLKNQNTFP